MKKRKFSLFDKFWYLKRAENFDLMHYRGVHIDGINCVEVDFENFFAANNAKKSKAGLETNTYQDTRKETYESERQFSAERLDAYDGSEDGTCGGKSINKS